MMMVGLLAYCHLRFAAIDFQIEPPTIVRGCELVVGLPAYCPMSFAVIGIQIELPKILESVI